MRPQLVSSIDIAPTILELCGSQRTSAMAGKNLVAVAQNTISGHQALFGESYAHDIIDLDDINKTLLYRWVIQGDYKLLLSYDGIVNRYKATHVDKSAGPQLYNLTTDPHELDNLVETNPKIVERLTDLLYSHWDHR
jgi:uncharacterized sulfatase